MIAPHRDPAVITLAEGSLRELDSQCSSLLHAVIVTDDGFAVSRTSRTPVSHDRFASMSSSVQALGDAVSRELLMGEADYVIIASDRGHVVQRRVPGSTLVIAAHFDSDETLGKAVSVTRRMAELLGEQLGDVVR